MRKHRYTLYEVEHMTQADINSLSPDQLKSATRAVYDALHKREQRLKKLDADKPIIAPMRKGLEKLEKLTDRSTIGKTPKELKRMLLKGMEVAKMKTTLYGNIKAGNKGFEEAIGMPVEKYFGSDFWAQYSNVFDELRRDYDLRVYSNTNIYDAIDEWDEWIGSPQTLTEFGAELSIYSSYDIAQTIKEHLLKNTSYDTILMREKKNENTENFLPEP